MINIKEQVKKELEKLVGEGIHILHTEIDKKKKKGKLVESTILQYQSWYTRTLPVVRQLIPERYQEFQEQYKLDKRNIEKIDFLNYTISDYLIGLKIIHPYTKEETFNRFTAFENKFQHQIAILKSAQDRIEYILSDIEGVLLSSLFDNELEVANELLRKGHLRAAGALAGVTLEGHLKKISFNYDLKLNKKDPSISDYNDELKQKGIYDVPNWRFIQRLADIRNLSVHAKEREPTKDEVNELIKGVQKVIKTFF